MLEEVGKALKSIKAGKAPGPGGLPVELLKLGEDTVMKALHRVIECSWSSVRWPTDWTQRL